MADTFTNLVARARSLVPDVDGDFVTDTDLGKWINEAYYDLTDRLDCVTQEFTGSTSGDTITLPPAGSTTVKRVESLRLADTNNIYADVAFVDDAVWNQFNDAVTDPGFTLGRVFDGSVQLFPEPDTGSAFALRCVIIPAALSGANVHELPVWCERKLVDYAIYRAMTKGGELNRAQSFLATYEQGLPDPAVGKDRIVPGPITIVPIIGPFELDPDAAHI